MLRKILLLSAGVAEEVVSKKGCSRLLPKLLAREVPNEGKGCSSPLPRLKHSLTLWPSIPRCPPLADIYRPCFTKQTFLIFLSKRVAVTSVQVLAKCFCKIFGENEGLLIDESGQPCLCTAFAQHCMDRTWLRRPTVALESGNDGLHFEPTTAGEGGYWVAGGVALAGAGAPFRPLVCQQRDNVPPDGHHRLSPASKSAFFPRPTVIASPQRGTCPWPAHEAAFKPNHRSLKLAAGPLSPTDTMDGLKFPLASFVNGVCCQRARTMQPT